MVERRLAAIMVTDVVGYSRLMGADEVGTLAALNAHRQQLVDPAIAAHHGRIVKTTGDGLLLEFASVVDAIACAVSVQRGMVSRNAGVPEDRRIVFRIGVNIGDVIIEGDDIFGDGVNVAARLEALCEPGGVCISRAANEQVRDKLSLSFADLGDHTVKNISRAVGVFGLRATDIASLPEVPLSELRLEVRARGGGTRPWLIGAGAAAAAVAVLAGVLWWFPSTEPAVPRSLEDRIAAAFVENLPSISAKNREETAAAYATLARHRALAMAPRAGGHWRTGDWPSREIAEEKVLERCQQFHDEPCAILAADDDVALPGARPGSAIRDMPRVRYAGLFNPERVPGLREKDLQRPEIAGYAVAPGPKAAAIHAAGVLQVATGAPSQRDAEEKALRLCETERTRLKAQGPCHLYAADGKVVLPLRSTTPLAAAAPAASAPFRTELMEAMKKLAPTQASPARESVVDAYWKANGHKAIAASPPGGTWRIVALGSVAAAEERVLEGCHARYGEGCVLVALDETLQSSSAPRPMARVGYAGLFDPQKIPAATDAVRRRADVVEYRAKQGAKAAAYHPWGRIFIVTDAPSQREAEERALTACNADPDRNGQAGPCLLYAVGDETVLTKRATKALTAP